MSAQRTSPSNRRLGRTLAALTALGLVAAACGDDDSDDTSDAADEQGPATDHDDHDDGDEHDGSEDDPEAAVAEEAAAVDAVEQTEPHPRLLLGDGETGDIEVLDLISGEGVGMLETDGLGALYVADRFVFAVDSDGDLVTVVDGGSWVVGHGDHFHAYTAEPRVVGTASGSTPIHTVHNDDQVAVFFDDDGSAGIFFIDDLKDGDVAAAFDVTTTDPHHGVVVPIDGHYMVSVPAPDPDDLPTGVEVRHGAEEVEASFDDDCPGLHGEAVLDGGVIFACEDGFLWVSGEHDEWTAETLAYPDHDGDPDARIGSFVHDHGVPVVAGQFDDDSVLIVDASGAPDVVFAELPAEVRAMALADRGAALLALTTDGQLHTIDTATGEIELSAEVLDDDPLPEDAEWWEPRRRMVVEGERAYISDPDTDTVTEVAINDGHRIARTFEASVMPEHIAVVGSGH